jgi:tyrosine-protein phosphatase SIW14
VSSKKTQNVVDILESCLDVVVMFYVTTIAEGARFQAILRSKLLHRRNMVKRTFWPQLCKTCVAVELFAALAFTTYGQSAASQLPPSQITSEARVDAPAPVRASFGAPAEKLKIAGVPNAGKISDTLFRGAQPSSQGLAELKKLGVTTIVDLRGDRGPVAQERAQAEALGLQFVDIPMSGWSAPSTAQVAQFLKLVQNDPAQKVFVHCYYGADRTGVMIAAYRIAQQNWTADQAIAEMYSFGFHYRWHPSMKSYVRGFPTKLTGDSAFASLRNSGAAERASSSAQR